MGGPYTAVRVPCKRTSRTAFEVSGGRTTVEDEVPISGHFEPHCMNAFGTYVAGTITDVPNGTLQPRGGTASECSHRRETERRWGSPNGVHASVLFRWRRRFRMLADSGTGFVPVVVETPEPASAAATGRIESRKCPGRTRVLTRGRWRSTWER